MRFLAAAFLLTWFLAHTWPGLFVYFTGDDVMNMYRAWEVPLPQLLWANLTPFTSVYRPAGSAFYQLVYGVFGFNALAFRLACYALLILNIGVTYRFARALTGSKEVALLASLFAAYHNHWIDLYQNGGTIYDILCYTFFYLALTFYIERPRFWIPCFALCSIAALNSKEMAFTLPAVLWIYELTLGSWRKRNWPLWLATLAVPLSVWAKTGASSLFHNNAGYATLGAQQFLVTTRAWLSQLLFLWDETLSYPQAVMLLFLPLLLGILLRHRVLIFCGLIIPLLPLPVNFIPLRNFFVMYLPIVPWAIAFATPLVLLRERLRLPQRPAQIALFLTTALALALVIQRDHSIHRFEWNDPNVSRLEEYIDALAACPALTPHSGVLLQSDPFEPEEWAPWFATRLYAHNPDIPFARVRMPGMQPQPGVTYTCVLAYDRNRFVAARN